jgi:DNA (cytosine-5)-methyltransferase 1
MDGFRLIDLFCGCGGMSLGFHALNTPERLAAAHVGLPHLDHVSFRSSWANDIDDDALRSYARNLPGGVRTSTGPIESFLDDPAFDFPKADVVVGGPPCQGFSLLNKERSGDLRRELWWHYLEVVARSDAQVLVMENVPQLLESDEYLKITQRMEELGFRYLMAGVLCAANYGVPQTRRRAILMASRSLPICLPTPTHAPKESEEVRPLADGPPLRPWRTVQDVMGDLPPTPLGVEVGADRSHPLALHFGRCPTPVSMERYRAVPPGGNRFDLQKNAPHITPGCWIRKTTGGTDLFGRLWWDRPSVTIRTEFYKPEKGRYLHPEQHRPITHREAARIQSFPDDFVFSGTKIQIAKQIGNAVPPVLSYHLAYEVAMSLRGQRSPADMDRAADVLRKSTGSSVKEVWPAKIVGEG